MTLARRKILIASIGTSPAVLTETVWALAHQEKSVVPDEVVVITTKSGKDALRAAVMSGAPCVWERLKYTIGFACFVREVSQCGTPAKNLLPRSKWQIPRSLSFRRAA